MKTGQTEAVVSLTSCLLRWTTLSTTRPTCPRHLTPAGEGALLNPAPNPACLQGDVSVCSFPKHLVCSHCCQESLKPLCRLRWFKAASLIHNMLNKNSLSLSVLDPRMHGSSPSLLHAAAHAAQKQFGRSFQRSHRGFQSGC